MRFTTINSMRFRPVHTAATADGLLKHTADVQADVLPCRYALVLLHFTMACKSYTTPCLDEDMDELAV